MNQMQALQQLLRAQAANDSGLVSFRAGRLFMDNNKLLTADSKRGRIKLVRGDDGVIKFQWQNRINNEIELELMLFLNTAKWTKINECKDGRVYMLKMDNNIKHFFWSQEPENEQKDNEYFDKINKLCRGESLQPANANANKGNKGNKGNNEEDEEGNIDANANANINANSNSDFLAEQQMLFSTYGAGGGGGNQNNNNNNNNKNNAANNSNINQLILNALQGAAPSKEQLQKKIAEEREKLKKQPDLVDILDPNANEEIKQLFEDEKVYESLTEHLPEDMRSKEDIIEQLQTPQFQGALVRLQHVINTPQLPLILQQMGLPANKVMGMTAFIDAINKAANRNNNQQNQNNNNQQNQNNNQQNQNNNQQNQNNNQQNQNNNQQNQNNNQQNQNNNQNQNQNNNDNSNNK